MKPGSIEPQPAVHRLPDERLLDCYRELIRFGEACAADWFQLGNRLHAHRHFTRAADCYQRCLALEPEVVEAHFNLGNTYLDLGRYADAQQAYYRSIELRPDYAEAHFNLGIACFETRRLPASIEAYRRALELKPGWVEALYNLGIALHEAGLPEEAAAAFRRALDLKPDFPEACNNLGIALKDQKALEPAAVQFAKAVALRADYAEAAYNLGCVRHEQYRLSEAAAAYRAALAVRPDHHKAWNNLAKVHQDQGEVDAALDAYLRALYLQPDYVEARFNLATVRLLKGDYRAAWEDYECRFRRSDWRRFYPHRLDQPRWKGDVFPGKTLLVHCEQGFGDMFQFVRYLPMVKARGGTVVLETRHAARRLFERLTGVDRVVTFSPEHPPTVDYDFYAPLLSLPGLFQTSLETVPRNIPYLSADPLQAREWDGEFDRTQLHVGLIWAGTATDPCRAAPLAWFTTLTQLPGIRIHGLQKGPAADLLEREGLPLGMRMQNLGPRLKDFSDTAAVIDRLDLIVSIDTSVAHLAGAMGKPVYLLLPAAADWRWLRQREDSPWYPTMRLFRQKSAGDWGPPLTRIARRLDWLGRMLQHARSQTGGGDLLAAARRLHHQGHPIEASIFYRRGRQASSC